MTQITLNIADQSILPQLMKMLRSFRGVSVSNDFDLEKYTEREYLKGQLKEALLDVDNYLKGEIDLPEAKNIHF